MSQQRRESQVTDEYGRPVPGAQIYVFAQDGTTASITSDGTTALAQPVIADAFGTFAYYAVPSLYREDTYFAGKLRYKEVTPVGLQGVYPQAPRAGQFFAFDADGNPVAASGTGADAALRTDLAANSGFTLIKYKNADANAFGRTGAQLKAMGAEDSDGLNFLHFVNPNEDDALIANSGVSALDTAFTNAFANLAAVQGSTGRKTRLILPAFVFPVAASLNFSVQDMVVDGGRAAKITSSFDGKAFGFNGTNGILRGIHFDQAAIGADPAPYFEHNAPSGIVEDCTHTRSATAHIPFYVRSAASGGRLQRCDCTWYGGVNLISNVSNFAVVQNRFVNPGTASDDGVAIKAVSGVSEHILVALNYFENMADFVGIGSEIGVFGTTDSNYSSIVRGIDIIGNRGKNCARMLMVKPGGVDGVDYRDGTVRNVNFSNNELVDEQGTAMLQPIYVGPGRGARVDGVTGKGNTVTGRFLTGATGLCVQYMLLRSDTGTAEVSVNNVDVQVDYVDRYKGALSGGSAPGAPATNGVAFEKQNSAVGTASKIVIDMSCNGTKQNGISIAAGFDNAIHIRRALLSNINNDGSTGLFGITVASAGVTTGTEITIDMVNPTTTFPYATTGSGTITCPQLAEDVYLFDKAAGTAATVYPWAAKRRCCLIKATIGITNTVTQSDTNYTSLLLKNKSGTDVTFASARTKVTAGGGNDIAIAPTSGLRTNIYNFTSLTLDSQRLQTLFTEGQTLHVDKNETGTGAALNDARLALFPVPY